MSIVWMSITNVAANHLIRKLRTLDVHVSAHDTKTNRAVMVHIHALLTSVLLQSGQLHVSAVLPPR